MEMGLKVTLEKVMQKDIDDDNRTPLTTRVQEEVHDVVPLDAGIQLTPSTQEEVDSEISNLCDEFQKAWWAEKKAKKAKDTAKKKLLTIMERRDITDWETRAGTFNVKVVKDSIGVIVKKAVNYLTPEQIEACTGVTRKGYVGIDFKPAPRESESD